MILSIETSLRPRFNVLPSDMRIENGSFVHIKYDAILFKFEIDGKQWHREAARTNIRRHHKMNQLSGLCGVFYVMQLYGQQ